MSTIRQRLTLRLLAGWCALLVIGGLTAYLTTRAALTRQFDSALRTKAIALSMVLEQDDSGNVVLDSSDQIMRDYDTDVRTAFFELWKTDGSAIVRSLSLHDGELPLRHQESKTPHYWNMSMPNGLPVRAASLRFQPHPADETNKSSKLVNADLVVAVDRRELDRALTTLAIITAGSAGLVLLLSAAAVPWFLRKELQPLNHLAEQAQQITAESLTQRFATEGLPGELAPIGKRLNDLLERLQASFERERQFGDNLAHEFRTPIAELRSLAELGLKWPDTRSCETDRCVLDIALQMETIINHLLAIARSENGQMTAEIGPVKPASLVTSIRQQLEQKAAARRLTIQAKIPPEMEIRTEPARLRSILTNLLNNAVQYSRPDGAVQIQGEGQNGRFTLSVTNPVESLRPEDLPHLFERFWRKDAARSGGEHFGLGLSLARAFASSLGFTLNATFDRDGRLRMTLAGPVDSEDSTGDNFDGKTNSKNRMNHKQLVVLGTLGLAFACTCQAGTELKWKDVPESVRATVLANGGVEGQTVDRENGKKNGMAFYEVSVKDKDGSVADLVITEDGKLVETKHDDAADRAAELAAKSDKKPKAAGTVLTMGKFSHPRDIYNPYLPLAYLKQDILDGSEDGKKTHVVRTLLPDKHKTFTIHGQSVEALVMEDRAFEDGQLAEVATDYFAQDDFGTVFYLGEDVDEYESGKLTSHNGPDAWMLGKDTQTPGIIMPAHPKVGDKFKSEDVSREINENDEVISLSATVTVPAGTFNNCVEIKETLADGKIEHKYYAPRVGVVREVPSSGDELLISHTTR